jgi:glutathione synthetase
MENEIVNLPQWIVNEMISYLYTHGLVMKTKDLSGVCHAPMSVFPSPIPKNFFDKIEFYQIAFNKMLDKMSRDHEFLHNILGKLDDSFISKYLEISKKAYNFNKKQKIQLGIFRNDYMIDKLKKFIFQVEINTIASSMGYFSDGIKQFYTYFSKKYPQYYDANNSVPLEKPNVIEKIVDSLYTASTLFSQEKSIIVFIVQENERNEFDQRSIENGLYDKYQIYSRRLTLKQFLDKAKFDAEKNAYIDSKLVSVVYFRASYTENDFTDEDCWKARELIELCTAIKCPNVDTFLCTFKIFQYYLQKPEILKKFVPEDLIANDMRRFFVKIFYAEEMSGEDIESLVKEIRGDLNKYIVKPMKEGGGNNYYNEEILSVLPGEKREEIFKNSIIMERINPPENETYVLHENTFKYFKAISELSVYGIILSDENTIHLNESVGFLLRTKEKSNQEGGVIIGSSVIDLPLFK